MPANADWLIDLVRLEITLWERIDGPLRAGHDLPLAHFEALHMLAGGPLRVGDLAQRLRVTVGGTSKMADRLDRAGLVRREPDPADRRASRIALTPAGRRKLRAATRTYERQLAAALDATLSADEQATLHALVRRLLTGSRDET